MKAVAVNQRGSLKDFIDLYFILQKTDLDFSGLSRLVIKKYRAAPSLRLSPPDLFCLF